MYNAKPAPQKYTYADYVQWDDGIRHELMDGVVYDMDAPILEHQGICTAIASQLWTYLRGKTCKVFVSPVDVRLNPDTADDTVVQPDILVVCDPKKLGKNACLGAPDLIVEILSPSTRGRDIIVKFNRYLQAGVREYWVVDPEDQFVQVHILQERFYKTQGYERESIVPVTVLEGCAIDFTQVFPLPETPETPAAPTGAPPC
jgi:Uma2 family endonuclease